MCLIVSLPGNGGDKLKLCEWLMEPGPQYNWTREAGRPTSGEDYWAWKEGGVGVFLSSPIVDHTSLVGLPSFFNAFMSNLSFDQYGFPVLVGNENLASTS